MNDHDANRGPGASGRIPEDAPGAADLEARRGDWDDAAMDRFWLGVYSRLERGLAWTLVSASTAVLLGYWAYVFATEFMAEFMADASVPAIVRFGTAGLLLGILLLLLGALRERIRAHSTDPFRRVRR